MPMGFAIHATKEGYTLQREIRISAACGCNIGKIRTNNEDNFLFDGHFLRENNEGLKRRLTCVRFLKKPFCCGVFDGMGGEAHGEVAAYIAAKTLKAYVARSWRRPFALEDFCLEANRRVCAQARKLSAGMIGATVAVVRFAEATAQVVNVGDSKVFLLRNGTLTQVSKDHTDKAFLESQGITKRKPRLTQHLGIEPSEMVIEPYRVDISLRTGDCFLLCSDGLTDMVQVEDIQRLITKAGSMEQAVEALVRMAMDAGGKDNTTVICCAFGE